MKMLRSLIAGALLLASAAAAQAQSGCSFIAFGAVLTAAQWNLCFQQKNDALGYTPVNKAGDTMLGKLTMAASTTSASGINIAPGAAPSVPVNGGNSGSGGTAGGNCQGKMNGQTGQANLHVSTTLIGGEGGQAPRGGVGGRSSGGNGADPGGGGAAGSNPSVGAGGGNGGISAVLFTW